MTRSTVVAHSPRPRRVLDISGQRFGSLVALRPTDQRTHGRVVWECLCDCGATALVAGDTLRDGRTRSCGCLRRSTGAKATAYKHGGAAGDALSPEYKVWRGIKRRCFMPNDPAYPRYGGRGIRLCDRWMDFNAFLSDMGPRPSPDHSIDRIDNDGNYEPGNCRWATRAEQSQNRRNTRLSPDLVREIRARDQSGERLTDIASDLSIPLDVCRLAALGRTWTNVDQTAEAAK